MKNIGEINKSANYIKYEIELMHKKYNNYFNKKKELINYYNSSYVLYCKNHNKICHKNCFGPQICSHFTKSDICDVCYCSKSNHGNSVPDSRRLR